MNKEHIGVAEAAEILNLCEGQVRVRARLGQLPIYAMRGNRYVFERSVIEKIAAAPLPLTLDDIGRFLGLTRQRVWTMRQPDDGRIPKVVWSTDEIAHLKKE